MLVLGSIAEAQLAKSGKYTGKAPGTGIPFKSIEIEKDHFFYQALAQGVFLNDAGDGFLHGSSVVCPYVGEITKAGFTGNGYCVMTDASGDKALAVFKCGPREGGGCEGDFQWTGGTGKYVGLKGANWFSSQPIATTSEFTAQWKGEWQLP